MLRRLKLRSGKDHGSQNGEDCQSYGCKASCQSFSCKKVKKEVRTTPKAKPKRVKEPVLETAGDASDQAAKREDGQAPMNHDGSGAPPSQLGYARGTVSALLTSLKYQVKAKKTSDSQKDDAQKVLQDRRMHV